MVDDRYYLDRLEKDGVYLVIDEVYTDPEGNIMHRFSALWRTNYYMGKHSSVYSADFNLIRGQCFSGSLEDFLLNYALNNRQVLIGHKLMEIKS